MTIDKAAERDGNATIKYDQPQVSSTIRDCFSKSSQYSSRSQEVVIPPSVSNMERNDFLTALGILVEDLFEAHQCCELTRFSERVDAPAQVDDAAILKIQPDDFTMLLDSMLDINLVFLCDDISLSKIT